MIFFCNCIEKHEKNSDFSQNSHLSTLICPHHLLCIPKDLDDDGGGGGGGDNDNDDDDDDDGGGAGGEDLDDDGGGGGGDNVTLQHNLALYSSA